jgi:predicted DNA-binding protein
MKRVSVEKSSASGITVRLPAPVRERVMSLARSEHRSAAAYIERLIERDLRERDDAERIVQVHVAPGLPEMPGGQLARESGESAERHARRASVLNGLFVPRRSRES